MRVISVGVFGVLAACLCTSVVAQDVDHPPHYFFELSDFELELGETLTDARVLYVTHGTLNAERSNAVLLPSFYQGRHHGYDNLIGRDAALDPNEYFVIVTEFFGSGGSSSPSNLPAGASHDDFPRVTIRDNVRAQHRLVTERFQIDHLRAVIGVSMGAQQAFQWAVSYPDFMDLIVPWNGTAKAYSHGVVRMESALTLITHDPSVLAGHDTVSSAGARAWELHWLSWRRSTEWFRLNLELDQAGVQAFVDESFSTESLNRPHDRVVQGRTWQLHNVGETPGFDGDVERALASIKALVLYMPTATDMYFPITDAEYERQFIPNVDFRPIPSIWGHLAPGTDEERAFLMGAIREALEGA